MNYKTTTMIHDMRKHGVDDRPTYSFFVRSMQLAGERLYGYRRLMQLQSLRLTVMLLLLMVGAVGAWAADTVKKFYDGEAGKGAQKVTAISFAGQPLVYVTYGSGTWTSQTTNGANTNEGSAHSYAANTYTSNQDASNNKIIDGFSLTSQPAIPSSGAYVKIEVERRGTIRLAYFKNDGVNFALLRVRSGFIDDYRFIASETGDNKDAFCEFKAEPGVEYYFFGNPMNFRFYGLSYVFEAKEWDFKTSALTLISGEAGKTIQQGPELGTDKLPSFKNSANSSVESTIVTSPWGKDLYFQDASLKLANYRIGSNGYLYSNNGTRTIAFKALSSGTKIYIEADNGNNDSTAGITEVTTLASASFTNNGDKSFSISLNNDGNYAFDAPRYARIFKIDLLSGTPTLPYFSPSYLTRIIGVNETSPMATLYKADGTVVSDPTYT